MFLLFYFFAFLCVRNVVLKEKFWVENFILFKLCYFYVIIYSVALFYFTIFRRKPSSDKRKLSIPFNKK